MKDVIVFFNHGTGMYDVIVLGGGDPDAPEGVVVAEYHSHAGAISERNRLRGNPLEVLNDD